MKRVLPLVLLALLSCEPNAESPVQPERDGPSSAGIQSAILDGGVAGGNPGFWWLPPMVKQGGKIEGEFDSSFLPFITVEVCEWDGSVCVGQLIRSFTSASTGSERLRISSGSGGQHYHVNWHTGEDELDSDSDYRIRGLMGALEVGFADVDVVDTGTELKGVGGGFVGLVNGRTLPI